MTKSYVDILLQSYEALLKDCTAAFPRLEAEFRKDFTHLQKSVECRGIRVLLTELPDACKHLDRCLDNGAYVPSRLPLTAGVSRTVVIPKLFRGLYLRIFDPNGLLKEDVDVEAIVFLRQLLRMAKKSELLCPSDAMESAKVEFIASDCSLPEVSNFWLSVGGTPPAGKERLKFAEVLKGTEAGRRLIENDPSLGSRLDYVFARIMIALGTYNPEKWSFRHGPGAIASTSGRVNKYNWYSWPDSLEHMFPIADYGFYSFSSWAHVVSTGIGCHSLYGQWSSAGIMSESLNNSLETSRLAAVRKTYDKPRLIGIEPNSHMWCQQNLRAFMYERTAATWLGQYIKFRDQTQNQVLCRSASRDGSLATLDLSEASDRISCNVVQAAFGASQNVLLALRACRTRTIRVPLDDLNVEVDHVLKKFSTMGSAVTFPVQSLLFLGIALAIVAKGNPERLDSFAGSVSVFGDDIIVPSDTRDQVVELLEALCFKVNADKSFSGSNFRESCGVDAFRGVEVTPTYLHHLLPSDLNCMVGMAQTANHFYKRWMLNVSAVLRRTVRKRLKLPDIHVDSDVMGFASRVRPIGVPKYRWNKDLQRVECKVAGVSAEQTKHCPNDDSCILQYFTEEPMPHNEWESGYVKSPVLKSKHRWEAIQDLFRTWID